MRHVDQVTSDQAWDYFRNNAAVSFHEDGREAWHLDTSTETDFLHRLSQQPDAPVYLVSGYDAAEISQRLMDEFPLAQMPVINGRKTSVRKVGRFNDALVIKVGGQEFALSFDIRPY